MKPTTLIAASLSTVMLGACTPPTPLSDAQVKMVTEECAKHGKATFVFNSVLVSRAECIETTVIDKVKAGT